MSTTPSRPQQAAAQPQRSASDPSTDEESLVEEELTPPWVENVRQWVVDVGAWYFVSMTVHMTAIIVAGLVLGDAVVASRTGNAPAFDTAVNTTYVDPPTELQMARLDQKIVPSQTLAMTTVSGGGGSATVGGLPGGVAGVNFTGIGGGMGSGPQLNGSGGGPRSGSGGMGIDVGAVSILSQGGGTLASAVPTGTLGDGLATAQGYGDAMDRITQEVLNALAKQKVLLVWIMDQSESMQDDREEIAARIERVYQELGFADALKSDALLTGVVSYGASALNHTPKPTAKTQEIMAAIAAVPNDPTGLEMQSQAILFAAGTYGKIAQTGNRSMALVLVTDESGDTNTNISQTESAIQTCKSLHCKVYVLGREAVFGYPYAHMRWTDAETKTTHWLRIDRGPETPQPEQLQINGFHRRWDAFPSGFGPYEQSRIARQTGGVFFMLPSPEVQLVGRRADLLYDADAMRPYLPELSARQDYVAERDRSPLRRIVFQVISDLNPYQAGSKGSRVEVRTDHFSIDRGQFAQQAVQEMKKAADLIMYLKEAQKALESAAPLREREKSPRWRANYDLIYAQTISYQARLQEYGWYMAEFIKTPKAVKNPLGPARPTNGWDVGTVKRLLKPDVTQTQRDQADALFRKVQKEYAGTPWAARAAEELARGYGIELHEDFEDLRGRGVKLPQL